MTLAKLALRNVLRQRRRTILTLLVLVASYVALALAGGFMAQTFEGLADGAVRGGLGHLQILPKGALDGEDDQSLDHAIPDGEAMAARLRQDPAVAEVLPRIQFMGLVSNGSRSAAYLGTAVDALREPRFMTVETRIRDGAKASGGSNSQWLHETSAEHQVVLGIGLAKSLGVGVGSGVTLMSTTRDGALNAVDVEVVGLQDLGFKELNDRSLTVSLDTGRLLLDSGPACSRLSLVLRHPERLSRELPRLAAMAGPGCEARPWFELASFYGQVKLLYFAIFGFMGLVLSLVVLLATANTLLMSVMERLRELGTLRAIGMQPSRLLALLQWEGAILGVAGSLLGLAFTLILRMGLNALHIQMPAPPGTSHGYELYIHFVPLVYLAAFAGLQTVIQLAALAPGLKASKIRIVEALRNV